MSKKQEQIDFLKNYRNKFDVSEKLADATINYVGFMQTLKEIYSDNLFVGLLLQKENPLRISFQMNKPKVLDIMNSAINHYEEIP